MRVDGLGVRVGCYNLGFSVWGSGKALGAKSLQFRVRLRILALGVRMVRVRRALFLCFPDQCRGDTDFSSEKRRTAAGVQLRAQHVVTS